MASGHNDNAQPVESKDDEWNKQFHNLSKMLDHYLVTANASIPSMSQEFTQTSYSQPTTVSSAKGNQANLNPASASGLRGPSQFYANRSQTPNPYKPSSLTTNVTTDTFPQELGGLPKPQNQPDYPSGKKTSPRRSPEKTSRSIVSN